MPQKRKKSPVINKTDSIDVTFGCFSVGEFRVPYLSSVIRFSQAAEYLNLVTEDPKYANQDWTVTELFQRDVDIGRVINIANNYLNPSRAEKPAFFNSLSVVLSSKKDNKGKFSAPLKDDEFKYDITIGPITINYDEKEIEENYPASGTFGRLQWNREQVQAVAIDGQHRLAAIKELYDKKRSACEHSSISVLFLIIDKDLGFLVPKVEDPVFLMRQIFVDLNKYAIPVSRARNLLLDDRDSTALFVRSLIGETLTYIPTKTVLDNGLKVGKGNEMYSCLPLDLVDWHGESRSKVDQGPYITSILALEWIVRTTLRASYPGNRVIDTKAFSPDDDDYYNQLARVLSTWPESWEGCIKKHWEECVELNTAFNLNVDELNKLTNEYQNLWGPAITRLLTSVGPYRDLVLKRIKHKTISPQFGQWRQAYDNYESNKNRGSIARHYKEKLEAVEEELKETGVKVGNFKKIVDEIEQKIKNNNVLYYLVGQRSLFYALNILVSSRMASQWAEWGKIDLKKFEERGIIDFYAYYLEEALNALHYGYGDKTGLLFRDRKIKRKGDGLTDGISNYFWAGSLALRDHPENMDFSETAARRGSKWFVIFAHLYWLMKANVKNATKSSILKSIEDVEEIKNYKFGYELSRALGDLMGDVYATSGSQLYECPMAFLVNVLEDPSDEILYAATRERLDYVYQCYKK